MPDFFATSLRWLLGTLLIASTTVASAENVSEPQLRIDVLLDEDAHGATVEDLLWRPARGGSRAGRELLGRWDDGSGEAWWLFRTDGTKNRLATAEEMGGEVVAWGAGGSSLLVAASRGLHLFDVASGETRSLVEGEAENPQLSPDGTRLSFVRFDELYLHDVASGDTRRLTDDGEAGVVSNGTTDWVYWEEIWERTSAGSWWSDDSRKIAYYHMDDSNVAVYPLVDTSLLHPLLERQRYPKAGDPLPWVEVRVVDLESGATVKLLTGDDPEAYLARVHWHPDGEHLAVERLNRDQTELDLLLCSAKDGSCRELARQRETTWVNLGDEFVFLDGGRFLWSTEESGWRQLYLYEADGEGRTRLTPDGWSLVALDGLSESGGWIVFTAHATGPLGAAERHVFRGRLDGGAAVELTKQRGWNEAQVAPSGHWLHSYSSARATPRLVLRHIDRPGLGRPLPSRPPSYDVARLPQWEHLTIPGPGDAELPAQVLKPSGFDPERRYPVLMYHYGCPASQVVDDRWETRRLRFLWHRMMAERGYVVFSVDNEGSRFFGKRGEDTLHRRFGEIELAGQLAGVEYLKKQPWVDPERLGLWGWSGGGANTLYSLFKAPGVWKAGVAGAPVTDWRYYDAIWMERYLDRPRDNEEGYEASAPLTYAAELQNALLLIHGTGDNNVHPQNSWNLVTALVRAEKAFEMAFYPNARHSLQTFERHGQRHVFEKMTEFFDRHLKAD